MYDNSISTRCQIRRFEDYDRPEKGEAPDIEVGIEVGRGEDGVIGAVLERDVEGWLYGVRFDEWVKDWGYQRWTNEWRDDVFIGRDIDNRVCLAADGRVSLMLL